MKTQKAVYAASFDPITFGHINIIERMAPLYGKFIVLVAVDSRKSYTFTPEERVNMARVAVAHIPNVSVDVCVDCYVVKRAKSIGAQVIVRGLRNFKDLEDEQTLAEENRRICPNIETIWIPCIPSLMHVSSSMVKSHVGIDPDWCNQVARSVPTEVVAKLKERYIVGKARRYWISLMSLLGNPEKSDVVFGELVTRYSESHRIYHNLEHIVTMLDELEQLDDVESAIALAIWFHDSFYDTKVNGNEESSAQFAKEKIQSMGLPSCLGDHVSNLIIATKHTTIPTDLSAKILVDLDLMILGKKGRVFDEYEAGIRKEYSWVARSDYCNNRRLILQSFLNRPSIYLTKFFRDRYEYVARKNLTRSIKKLQN
jgi:pantetheine-phosphate adenylyltransferase